MKAPLSRRFWAFAIDWNTVGLALWLFHFAVGQPTHEGSWEYEVRGLPCLFVPLIWFCMLVIPESLFGAALGKKMLGLRVLRTNGERLGLGAATMRRMFDFVDFWASCCLVALLTRNGTKLGQRLGDVVSGAVVTLVKVQEANPSPQPTTGLAPGRG